jgi:hypothetical protein
MGLVILKKNTIDIRKFRERMKKTMQKTIKVETRIKLGMRTKVQTRKRATMMKI